MTTPWRLRVITQTADTIAEMERTLQRMVASARRDGYTWKDIGDAIGITRQAACQRFRGGRAVDDDPAQ